MTYANQDLLTPGRQLTSDEIDTLGSDLQRAFRLEAAASWLIPAWALQVYFGTQSQSTADRWINVSNGDLYVVAGLAQSAYFGIYAATNITGQPITQFPSAVQSQTDGAQAITGILAKFDEILAQTDPASVNASDTETEKLTQITRAISGLQLDRNAIVGYLSTYKTYLTDTRSGYAEFTTDILSDQLNFDGRRYSDNRFGGVNLTDTRSATVASLLYAPMKRAIETDVAAGANILAEIELLQQALGYQLERILNPALPPPVPPMESVPPVMMMPPPMEMVPAPISPAPVMPPAGSPQPPMLNPDPSVPPVVPLPPPAPTPPPPTEDMAVPRPPVVPSPVVPLPERAPSRPNIPSTVTSSGVRLAPNVLVNPVEYIGSPTMPLTMPRRVPNPYSGGSSSAGSRSGSTRAPRSAPTPVPV